MHVQRVTKSLNFGLNRVTFKMSLCLLLTLPPLSDRSRKWWCIKEFPQCWAKLDFLSLCFPQRCSASPGWEDNISPGACHVDRAAHLQYPQDMFFFPTVFPLLIYLFVYFTPITMSVLRDTVFYWSLIHPKDNVIPCLSLPHHSPHFSCSSLYCSPERRSKDKAVFLSHKQNMDKRRTTLSPLFLFPPCCVFPPFVCNPI